MNWLPRGLAGAMLALAMLAPARAQSGDTPPPDTPDVSRQVLVMLRMAPEHFGSGPTYAGGYGDSAGQAGRRRAAGRLAREHGLALVAEWPMPVLGVDCYVMAAPSEGAEGDAAAALSHDPAVAWSEPMHLYRTAGGVKAPNDPLFRAQPAAKAWRLADLHQIATGRKVRVAVVDSRIDERHPDLAGQVELSRDFVAARPGGPEDHGTGVAGVIAAVANNGQGIVGVAPGARLLGLRACWQQARAAETLCDTLSLARALNFAIENRAQVINLSLTGPQDVLLGRFLDVALARGAVVVGAVDPAAAHGGFPASHAGVIAVASDEVAAPPAAGVLLAPGRDIPTALPNGRWSLVQGSSFAAAHVSGLVALTREHGARPPDPGTIIVARRGVIDACATVLRASGPCSDCACQHPDGGVGPAS